MTMSPISYTGSLRIGTIEFVSPEQIKVQLDFEAPSVVALNTGIPHPFPRVNGYVLIPSDFGYLVAQVEWITIEHSQYPKHQQINDSSLVNLPFPLRKMSVNPLGVLSQENNPDNATANYRFRRGVESYPTIGGPVLLPSQVQLRSIVESGDNRRVTIGTSPLAANAKVMIDPDRLFGRHLAVLGNTGSGKSCSVAGLIRWSLEAAKKLNGNEPNARFIILDPNGEYSNTFKDLSKVRSFSVQPLANETQLKVPLWFWNSAEWVAFTQASSKTQRPALIHALRSVREGFFEADTTAQAEIRSFLRSLITTTQAEKKAGNPWGSFPMPKNFTAKIKKWKVSLVNNANFTSSQNEKLNAINDSLESLINERSGKYDTHEYSLQEINDLQEILKSAHSAFGGKDQDTLPIDVDAPKPFTGQQLLDSVEASSELLGVSGYVETMLMRINTILSDKRMKIVSGNSEDINLKDWLTNYIGDDQAKNGAITIIDLSLMPTEAVHLITAVIARMTMESLQRYRKINNGKTLPTVLVMEEAHTFIKRYKDDSETQSTSTICCQVFEKIAREGRKYGLGLVVSSQRPSELSPTVLSQCNSYLLHRISNDRDQELIQKLVPDNLRGLLRDLPSLPSRNAILLGWASELPVLVEMTSLPTEHRPRSDDPDFWAVWSGKDINGEKVNRKINWDDIAADWQGEELAPLA